MRMEGLLLVGEAVAAAMDGRPVDVPALRAALVHEGDQVQALGAHLDERGIDGRDHCDAMATLLDRLGSAVDELEAGQVEAARTALREALCSTFGR